MLPFLISHSRFRLIRNWGRSFFNRPQTQIGPQFLLQGLYVGYLTIWPFSFRGSHWSNRALKYKNTMAVWKLEKTVKKGIKNWPTLKNFYKTLWLIRNRNDRWPEHRAATPALSIQTHHKLLIFISWQMFQKFWLILSN